MIPTERVFRDKLQVSIENSWTGRRSMLHRLVFLRFHHLLRILTNTCYGCIGMVEGCKRRKHSIRLSINSISGNLRFGENPELNLWFPLFPIPCDIVRSSASSRSLSSPDLISSFISDRRVPVGDARALNSAAEIETPALAKSFEANSGSNGLGIGKTGKSLVEIPRCCLDMWEWSELRDLATVPHNTHLYPGQIVCLSSRCVLKVCADR